MILYYAQGVLDPIGLTNEDTSEKNFMLFMIKCYMRSVASYSTDYFEILKIDSIFI